jgi:hypothetical protein
MRSSMAPVSQSLNNCDSPKLSEPAIGYKLRGKGNETW